MAESYIAESFANKIKTGNAITSSLSVTSVLASAELARCAPLVYNQPQPSATVTSSDPNINNSIVYKHVHTNKSKASATVTSSNMNNPIVYNPVHTAELSSSDMFEYNDDFFMNEDPLRIDNPRDLSSETSSKAAALDGSFKNDTVDCNDTFQNVAINGHFSDRSEATHSSEENDVQASQVSVSHHNFMSRMEKQFSFYKCEGFTINFK